MALTVISAGSVKGWENSAGDTWEHLLRAFCPGGRGGGWVLLEERGCSVLVDLLGVSTVSGVQGSVNSGLQPRGGSAVSPAARVNAVSTEPALQGLSE